MRCKECGEIAQDHNLRYCENCGAKMPAPPPGTVRRTSPGAVAPQTTGRTRGTAARAVPTRDEAEDTDPGLRAVHSGDVDEHTDPGRSVSPPYDGPVWLAHVPGHSPSVAGVGPFWSLVVFAGGWLVTAREMRAAGEQHPLVDWVPPALLHPAVPAAYAAVTAGLAIRMLGIGLTPLLWLGGAGLLGYDQYRKVYVGEEGLGRFFDPRQLLRGMAPVALGGVALCLVALFLTWTPVTGTRYSGSAPVPSGPPQLRVLDAPRPSSDSVYSFFDESYDKGWDLSFSVTLEMLLLAVLGFIALRPEVPRPDWTRFAPIGVVVLGVVWALVNGGLQLGPLLFLAGLAAVGFATVYRAIMRAE